MTTSIFFSFNQISQYKTSFEKERLCVYGLDCERVCVCICEREEEREMRVSLYVRQRERKRERRGEEM